MIAYHSTVCREVSTSLSLESTHPDTSRRPRELLLQRGREALRDEDLLAIILRTGTRGCNVLELSSLLLRHYGSLHELSKASPEELAELKLPGLGAVKVVELSAVLEIARRITEERCPPGSPLVEPAMVTAFIRPYLLDVCQECFFVLPLDRKYRLIGRRPILVGKGLADTVLVHPREVFRACVRVSAIHAIVVHNHPSGDPTPSRQDIHITRQLLDAGKVMGISLLDHIVVGSPDIKPYLSFREREIVSFAVGKT